MKNGNFHKKAVKSNNFKKAVTSHKFLAQERTVLANERNTLAYVRTGFAAFVLGIALVKLFGEQLSYVYIGYAALIVGVLFVLFGIIYYPIRKKRILDQKSKSS